jgi:lactoylglutathione lyase
VPPFPVAEVGVQQLVPLLNVVSMDASLKFYVDGLGFEMKNKWIDEGVLRWCWIEQGGAALMLQELLPDSRVPGNSAKRGAPGVGFNFVCDDALAFYHAVKARGIACRRPFVGNRMWVASLEDPDGYSLHFESTTDAAEESEYQEPA